MKEKIKIILKWVFLVAVAVLLFYFLFPKYDFIGEEGGGTPFLRCNKILGTCDRSYSKDGIRYWESFIK